MSNVNVNISDDDLDNDFENRIRRGDNRNDIINKKLERLWNAYENATWSDDKDKILDRIHEVEKYMQ